MRSYILTIFQAIVIEAIKGGQGVHHGMEKDCISLI